MVNFELLFSHVANDYKILVICFYTTFTQYTSIYQNICLTQNFDRNVMIGSAYNMFVIRPIS